jgi:hypothetical protein
MEQPLPKRAVRSRHPRAIPGLILVCAMALCAAGCQKIPRTSDPQLKPIQDMLDAQLPAGTPQAHVLTFLNNRGYAVLPTGQQGTIVTSIRHIDPQTVTPVTARVTFYFDANDKLNTYELQRTFNEPPPKAEEPAPAAEPQAQPPQQ